MKTFPNESTMPRSTDGSEPIRGGSVGLNRILGYIVHRASQDRKPQATAVMLSAFTIFRNVWGSLKDPQATTLDRGFVDDLNLFLEYYDIYLSGTWNPGYGNRFCPVVVYFPEYHTVEAALRKELVGDAAVAMKAYLAFLKRNAGNEGEVRKLDHSRCIWIKAGQQTYPHREVVRKFRDMTHHQDCLYTSADPIWLVSHIPLDRYMAKRLRGVNLLESYQGRIITPDKFHFKLDKEGRIPWMTTTHIVFGDGVLIQGMATRKDRKILFEDAVANHWLSRTESEIQDRIVKLTQIPKQILRKYDFV